MTQRISLAQTELQLATILIHKYIICMQYTDMYEALGVKDIDQFYHHLPPSNQKILALRTH